MQRGEIQWVHSEGAARLAEVRGGYRPDLRKAGGVGCFTDAGFAG